MDAGLRIDIPDTCANLIDCKTQTAGILCLILNCFLPGIGSIIAGVVSTRLFRTRAKQLARALSFYPTLFMFRCFIQALLVVLAMLIVATVPSSLQAGIQVLQVVSAGDW